MRIFVTGATGFIGSAIVEELISAGHQVFGLARSDAGAKSLAAAGAQVHRGSLEDLDSLRRGAAASDGVIHTAFIHDFANYAASAEADKRAIEALGAALEGSGRPLVVTSGSMLVAAGRRATEEDVAPMNPNWPRVSEQVALPWASRGVRVSVVRLPPTVHGDGDHGFVPALIGIARQKRLSAYVGDGRNRWPAVHRFDAANLFRLAVEKAPAGAKLHGAAEEGIPFRDIAAVIGRRLNLPVESKSGQAAADHFGWMTHAVSVDNPTSSTWTQERLGWRPTRPALIPDLDRPAYFETSPNARGSSVARKS